MITAIAYTVGIRRKLGFFFRRYKVIGHQNESLGDSVRLILRLVDGSVLIIPEITKKSVIVYPDYTNAAENLRRIKGSSQTAPKVEDLRDAIQ